MNRTDRLYALVEELRAVAPRPRSARWLAGRFEVSARTVERDIGALQQSGVPLRKLVAAMQTDDAAAARDLAGRVHLLGDAGRLPPVPRPVADAVGLGRVLRLGYADRDGTVTARDVEPLGYVGREAYWYLVAWCRLRDGVRAFRTDRITSAAVTAEAVEPRPLRTEDLGITGCVHQLSLT